MTDEDGKSLKEHRMEINVIEKSLRNLYYNPETGYYNAEKLFKDIQKYDFGITRKGVQCWLEAQPAYTLHIQLIIHHPKPQTWVRDLGEQLQIHLIFMGIENNKSKWAKESDGYNYIVLAIEVLSRYAFTIPTKTKDEVTLATETILEEFHNRFDRYPKFIVSDYGSEFVNNTFKNILKKYPAEYVKDDEVIKGTIEWFSPKIGRHLAMIERFNRTLKGSLLLIIIGNGRIIFRNSWMDTTKAFIEL